MAVVNYGFGVAEIRGTIGSTTYQKCGQSKSMRINTQHKAPQSQLARISRQNFSIIANAWRILSLVTQTNWTNAAHTYPTVDSFGNAVILTGYQLFFYINRVRQLYNGVIVTTASNYIGPAISDIDFDPISVATSHWNLLWNNAIAANTVVLIYISPMYPGNSYNANPKYYFAFAIPPGTAVGTNFYAQYLAAAKFPPVTGMSFYWKALKVNQISGNYILDNSSNEVF